MLSDQIREAYLSYFEEKEHKRLASSSLIPHGDPTLLLTAAGMVQFKPYFTGEETPPATRLTTCQKCFRTTDIESVGDVSHLTFFEMLGNFSVGDYFKEGAIQYAWEFVTERMGIPEEKLWITIYLDDDEAFGYWRNIGVPAEKIVRHGEKDNFWGPVGDSGPCGPCSEIYYDYGPDTGCNSPDCIPGCDCPRYLEIWNLVFMQYNQDVKGNRTPLPRPNIDTGMGLERMAAVMQGKFTCYDTDVFGSIIANVSELSGYSYGKDVKIDRATRVVAEHSRSVAFLIADGVLPANDGRGYVLRRVLRRAALFGKTLGMEGQFISEIASTAIDKMSRAYPELVGKKDYILNLIDSEEEKFSQTLTTGLNLLDGIVEKLSEADDKVISGQEVFKLYDTYGFPKELTAEVAADNGLSVDIGGFEKEMDKQRKRARASQRSKEDETAGVDYSSLAQTEFLGYESLICDAHVLSLAVDGRSKSSVSKGEQVKIVLDKTPFYAEKGGQVADTGIIAGKEGKVQIEDTRWAKSDHVIHFGKVLEGSVSVGHAVSAQVDVERRLDIARNHTATHLLQSALRQVLGNHVHQTGSLVGPDRLRFDFSHNAAVSKDELIKIQRYVNDKVRQDLYVEVNCDVPIAQAKAEGAMALFGEKYGDSVRMLKVGDPPVSVELCGGTHLDRTGQIGLCLITSESSVGSGMRRIEAVTGRGAESLVEDRFLSADTVAQRLGTSLAEVDSKLEDLLEDLSSARKRLTAHEREMHQKGSSDLMDRVVTVDGVSVLAAEVSASNVDAMRRIGDMLKQRMGSGVIVLGAVFDDKPSFIAMATPDMVAKGIHAGNIVKRVANVAGGGGGGRPDLGQAGGRDKSKLEEALQLVPSLIKSG
ncbi:alanine--tRNA ligase [Chloroflexota bacterium]